MYKKMMFVKSWQITWFILRDNERWKQYFKERNNNYNSYQYKLRDIGTSWKQDMASPLCTFYEILIIFRHTTEVSVFSDIPYEPN